MTPESQRIAIATACGWIVLRLSRGFYAKHKTEGRISISAASARATQNDAMSDNIPDYLNDLNAMHQAEKTLTADQWYEYDRLMPLRDPQKMHASAAQRAEAFLRTLGKWEGTK